MFKGNNIKKDPQFGVKSAEQLQPESLYHFNISRREFFGVLGSGLAVAFTIGDSLGKGLTNEVTLSENQVAAWIHIGENGTVTVFTGKAEVGQNIRTSLAQIVAEELDVPMDTIAMVMGDTAITPYDMGTFGSRSIPYMGPQLRKAAATARELLIDMAAAEWKTDRGLLFIEKGQVKNRNTQQSTNIGQLTKGKELIKSVNEKVSVTPVDQWKIAGTSVTKVNGESFVTGMHKYVSDMKLPGMMYGKILRPPAFGATLASVDLTAAQSIKGVTVVHDGNFVGVAAVDLYTASEVLKLIKVEWNPTPQPSQREIFDYLKKNIEGNPKETDPSGDVIAAFARAEIKLAKTFNIEYIAHAPLEPRAGLAKWENNKLTVWTGTQRPFGVQEELSEVFNIPKEDVRVIMPDTGSGYGGKHSGEAGIEAARLSKETRTAVKVVWTREEEFTWAYFRPAGVIEVKAGATKDGILESWEFHNYNSGGSGIWTVYDVANKKIQFHPSRSPLRQGSYRGLAATANVFARESMMNDLAEQVKMDPLAFRLKNLSHPRMKDVLNAAAKAFGWTTTQPVSGHGFGIACGDEKGSYVATCAEVSVDASTGEVKVLRVVVSFECGAIINPEHLKSQIQGSVIQGLGGALFEKIEFSAGKILNPLFSKYRVPRFSDLPALEVVMLNRKDIPSAGAGETPILGIAPAVRNAIANATGKKLYRLPLVPNGLEQ